METKPLTLSKGFAKVSKVITVGTTGRIFLVKMNEPLGEANYVLILNKSRDREAVKDKMQAARKAKGIACNRGMNNQTRKSWWACWGFPNREKASKALLFAQKNLFKASAKVGNATVSLFDEVHQDRAKNFFIAHAKYQKNFSDNLD